MRSYLVYAALAGIAWGAGGYLEKTGLRRLGLPPLAGIALRTAVALAVLGLLSLPLWRKARAVDPAALWLIAIGGGVVAGSLGMWSFYQSLATTESLGASLAVAFALSPVAGTLIGVARREQPMDIRTAAGLLAILAGIVLLQVARRPGPH